jgi:hypothetical protein
MKEKDNDNELNDQKSSSNNSKNASDKDQADTIIDFGEEPSEESEEKDIILSTEPVTPKDKFILAKWILAVSIVIMLIFSSIHLAFNIENSKEIWSVTFELGKTVILLIIGFYFGVKDKD